MEQYCRELEALITDVLLPAYLEHARLTGKPDPLRGINANLIAAMKTKRKIPYLLQRQNYGPNSSKAVKS